MTNTDLIERHNNAAIAWASARWPHPWDYAEREAAEEAFLAALTEANANLEVVEADNFRLAAGACIYPNGEGLLGDEHGNSFCSLEAERARLDARETELMAQLNETNTKLEKAREGLIEVTHFGDRNAVHIARATLAELEDGR